VPNGRGRVISSGSNAQLFGTSFLESETSEEESGKHEGRLAVAFGFDPANRILDFGVQKPLIKSKLKSHQVELSSLLQTIWRQSQWPRAMDRSGSQAKLPSEARKTVPTTPFRVLDAPGLRDDFYCSLLAYCPVLHVLAVGLETRVFIWSEDQGPRQMSSETSRQTQLTSISFSSTAARRTILAAGRIDGKVSLWSLQEQNPRFEIQQPSGVACVSWKPIPTPSLLHIEGGTTEDTEELLVRDEVGNLYYYSVEWPSLVRFRETGYHGRVTLLARINVHSQQICGLAWSPDGTMFATGGNDNVCCLFTTEDILSGNSTNDYREIQRTEEQYTIDGVRHIKIIPGRGLFQVVSRGFETQRWIHKAAVKAIAFCPWQRGLLATGGGSNDRCIHFYHAFSGVCLAKINVASQVTSLIWSAKRREIAATFGFASPEHPVRISVFSWPECQQLVAIP
jgi:meiosis-specific APC/C activator protein AMA1